MMMAHSVNYLSVLIAAVAAWLFGGVYYTALGRYWMAAQGKTMEQCQAEQAAKSSVAKVAPFIVVFVAEIIIGWALYGLLVHMNAFTLRSGVISAVLCWFGFVVTTLTSNYAFHGRRPMLTVIDSAACWRPSPRSP
jgi:putative Mn2+ efflux pump MntP